MSIQQVLSGTEHALIVIDDGNNLFSRLHKSTGPANLARKSLLSQFNYDRKDAGQYLPLWEGHRFVTCFYMLKLLRRAILGQQPKPFGNHRKFCKRTNAQLLHHLVPMQLDRSVGYPQFICYLFMRFALNQQSKNFALARCKLFIE